MKKQMVVVERLEISLDTTTGLKKENVFERMLFHTVKVLYPSVEQLKFLSELNKVWKDRILALWFNE